MRVLHLDLDFEMVSDLLYTHAPNYSSSLVFRCKEHPCPSSPHLGSWKMPEVPNWGLAS